ncbi:MAG: O-antigen ligase family protein [Ghiorsea sp.]|nr:O-antigen ligase family protein [Ghiorsea sp.]
MQHILIKWFPLLTFSSLMGIPLILNFSALSYSFMPIMFIFWLLLIHSVHPVQLPKLGMYLLVLLFISQSVLWLSGGLKSAEPMLLGMVWITVAFLMLYAMRYVMDDADTLFYSFIAVAVVWAVLGGIVWFGLTDGRPITVIGMAFTHVAQSKPTGPFANGNVFAILMLCAWLISIKFWLDDKKNKILFFVLAFFFLVWVFASMARGAWLAGSIIFIGLMFHLFYTKQWKKFLLLLFSAVLAWWLASEMVNFVLKTDELSERAESMLTAGARQILYPSVFEVWRGHWLLGVGFGNLVGHYLTGQAEAFAYLPNTLVGMGATSSSHNHLLHILSESGLVGLLLWIATAYLLFKSIIVNRFDVKSKAWLPLAMAMVLWVQGLFNISMNEALPFFFFFVCLGLGMAFQQSEHTKAPFIFPKIYFSVGAVLVVLVLAFYSYSTWKAWNLYEQMINTQEGTERGKIVGQLFRLNHNNIYPYVINSVVSDFMVNDKDEADKWMMIQPNIKHALTLEEWPTLYQGLFYSYMLNEEWDKACELGEFLKQQHWQHDQNNHAYESVCQQEKTGEFTLGW